MSIVDFHFRVRDFPRELCLRHLKETIPRGRFGGRVPGRSYWRIDACLPPGRHVDRFLDKASLPLASRSAKGESSISCRFSCLSAPLFAAIPVQGGRNPEEFGFFVSTLPVTLLLAFSPKLSFQ